MSEEKFNKCPNCGEDIVAILEDGKLQDVMDGDAWAVRDWE